MKFKTSIATLSLAVIVGCGTSDNDNSKGSVNQIEKGLTGTQLTKKKEFSKDVPLGTIMIAEVDENGKVISSQMRTVNESVEGKSEKELIKLFSEKGKPIENVVKSADDLDSDSSTQMSWSRWHYNRRYSCGRWSYCNYRPSCYYQGYSYNYQSVARYQVSGYIPAYSMPYETYQSFQASQSYHASQSYQGMSGYGAGYSASSYNSSSFNSSSVSAVGYQPFYPAGAVGGYPVYGEYSGATSNYQVYGWNRVSI